MNKRANYHRKNTAVRKVDSAALCRADLVRAIDGYLLDSRVQMQSPRTTGQKSDHLGKLLWFLDQKGFAEASESSVQQFLAYIPVAHMEPGGRWGLADRSTGMPGISATKPVGRNTVRAYFKTLLTFFKWCIRRRLLQISPMALLEMPRKQEVEVLPMSIAQIEQLEAEAARGRYPERDVAMIRLLFDRGLRAAELVDLKMKHVDPFTNQLTIEHGKGGKPRTVYMGKECGRILWEYMNTLHDTDPDDPLFPNRNGDHLRPNGLSQMIRKTGKKAKVSGVRCSPHTIRHSYAVETLEAGASTIYLMRSMGHKTIDASKIYANFVGASMQRQAAMFAPGDKIKRVGTAKRGRPRGDR